MSFGIIDLNVIPVRLKDNAKSEMISQFFFGETLTILEKSDKWSYFKSNLYQYKGWIRDLHFKQITKNQNMELESQKKIFSSNEIKLTKNILTKRIHQVADKVFGQGVLHKIIITKVKDS